jgi:hypothetical protein
MIERRHILCNSRVWVYSSHHLNCIVSYGTLIGLVFVDTLGSDLHGNSNVCGLLAHAECCTLLICEL